MSIGAISVLFLLIFSVIVHAAELPVTSPFGWRVHPITGAWRFHTGIDLGYDYGTPIPAMFDGFVVQSGDYFDGYGNQVLLYHPALDAYTRYGHMSSVAVGTDAWVMQGQCIGYVGSTGNSTGPHLHLEYIVRGDDGNFIYVDPLLLWQ